MIGLRGRESRSLQLNPRYKQIQGKKNALILVLNSLELSPSQVHFFDRVLGPMLGSWEHESG